MTSAQPAVSLDPVLSAAVTFHYRMDSGMRCSIEYSRGFLNNYMYVKMISPIILVEFSFVEQSTSLVLCLALFW